MRVEDDEVEERLQKILASGGIASRRKAEEMIAEGRVKVNGKVIDIPGTKADLGKDIVEVDDKRIGRKERKVYVLLYKPKGYLCTVTDTHDRPTVLSLLPDWGLRVYPVGRLDMDTAGALILTNDGKFTNAVLHPAKKVDKVYRVLVEGQPVPAKINLLRQGLELEEETFAPAKLRLIAKKGRDSVWEVIIHEGKKRQVRRMFKAIHHPVIDLTRTQIGFLSLKGLKEGEWRFLKKEELHRLTAGGNALEKNGEKELPKIRKSSGRKNTYGKRTFGKGPH